MRMSCNGCRVLRKGCNDNCSIRPSLQWINNPDSQANATLFLAKFYGRAGLINLINAGPDHIRPAIFRSLLYEACGRIVNPIYGSVGLLWSGNWKLCQNAVEAVLKGNPITQIAIDAAETKNGPPLKAYNIRHVSKDENSAGVSQLHRVRNRCRFKRSASKPNSSPLWAGSGDESGHDEFNRSPSHESSLSHQSQVARNVEAKRRETRSFASVDVAEAQTPVLFRGAEPEYAPKKSMEGDEPEDGEFELELTLGFEPVSRPHSVKNKKSDLCDGHAGVCKMALRLDYTA